MPPAGGNALPPPPPLERFYDFYTLLSFPLPPSASWLGDTNGSPTSPSPPSPPSPTSPFSEEAVKKAYRKASLKHHPDKGGNPLTFVRLKRAQHVLSDSGLRARYDLLGLDTGRDDCASKPEAEAEEGEAEEAEGGRSGTALKRLQAGISGHLMSAIVRTVALYLIFFLAQYFYLLLVLSAGFYFVVAFKGHDVDKEVRIVISLVPLLLFAMCYSKSGGWIFWLGETAGVTLALFFALPSEAHSLPLLGGLTALGASLAWWWCGRFWQYLSFLLLLAFLFLLSLVVFPLVEFLIKDETESLLKAYSEKMKEAVIARVEDEIERRGGGKGGAKGGGGGGGGGGERRKK